MHLLLGGFHNFATACYRIISHKEHIPYSFSTTPVSMHNYTIGIEILLVRKTSVKKETEMRFYTFSTSRKKKEIL